MKKAAYAVGIAMCVFALGLLALIITFKSNHSDCRYGKGLDAIESCTFMIKYVPVETLRNAYRYTRSEHYYQEGMKGQAFTDVLDIIGLYESGRTVTSERTAVLIYQKAAFLAYEKRDLSLALKYADMAIQKGSRQVEMFVIRADTELMGDKLKQALADLQQASELGYPRRDFYFKQGLVYQQLGDLGQAYTSFTTAEPLITEPERSAKLNGVLGIVCVNLKRYEEAVSRLKKAEAAGFTSPEGSAAMSAAQKALETPAKPARKKRQKTL